MTQLEQSIYNYLNEGDKFLTVYDLCEYFSFEKKSYVKKALDTLEEQGLLYSIDSIAGKMYGINQMETSPTINVDLNTGEGMGALFNELNGNNTYISQLSPYPSDIDSEIKHIDDEIFKNMNYSLENLQEWIQTIILHFDYLNTVKTTVLEQVYNSFDELNDDTFPFLCIAFESELISAAKIRSLYCKEIVEVANIIIQNNMNHPEIESIYEGVIGILEVCKVEMISEDIDIQVEVPDIDKYIYSLIKPH